MVTAFEATMQAQDPRAPSASLTDMDDNDCDYDDDFDDDNPVASEGKDSDEAGQRMEDSEAKKKMLEGGEGDAEKDKEDKEEEEEEEEEEEAEEKEELAMCDDGVDAVGTATSTSVPDQDTAVSGNGVVDAVSRNAASEAVAVGGAANASLSTTNDDP